MLEGVSSLAKKAMKTIRSQRGPYIEAHVLDHDKCEGDETVGVVNALREEARKVHGRIEQEAIAAIHEYMGNQWDAQRDNASMLDSQLGTTVLQAHIRDHGEDDDLVRPVLNRTQNAVLSNTEARTSRPVEIRYEPEETGEPEEFWLSKRGAETLKELRADAIANLVVAGAQQALMEGDENMVGDSAAAFDVDKAKKSIDAQYPDIASRMNDEHGLAEPLSEDEAGAVKQLIEQACWWRPTSFALTTM